jgi:hypothetical protein
MTTDTALRIVLGVREGEEMRRLRALSESLQVNLYSPDPRRKRDMLRRYGERCSICF